MPLPPQRLARLCLVLLLAALAATVQPGPVSAQNTDVPATEEDLARISDAELRALLIERLDLAADEEAAEVTPFNPAHYAFAAQHALTQMRSRLREILSTYNELPAALGRGVSALVGDSDAGHLSLFAALFAIAMLAGALAEVFVRRRTQSVPSPLPAGTPPLPLTAKLNRAFAAMTAHTLYVVLFAGVAGAVFLILHDGPGRERVTFAFYLAATLILRLIGGASRAYASPKRPDLRIPLFTDAQATRVHFSVLTTTALAAFGFFTCAVFGTLGVHGDVHLLLLMIVGSVATAGLVATFLGNRRALATDLGSGDPDSRTRRRYAKAFPWILAVLVVLIWVGRVGWTLIGGLPLFGAALVTIAVLVLWPSLDAAVSRDGRRAQADGNTLGPPTAKVLRVALGVASLFLLALAWRVNLLDGEAGIGASVIQAVLQVGVVILLAYAGWEALRVWIDRKIAAEDAAARSDGVDMTEAEIGGTGLSRMRTLLPLFKRAGQVTILVIGTLVVLSSLGVAIAPVLAGAGVIGIAIGFGSQTLVRDIVSGAFFLMDDAFRLGEYIDLGVVKGSVERINTRSLQLRHHRGALHTVPFGEIQTLTNYSRDWAIMKLRFRVPFDTDIERVRKLLKVVGKELLEHPDIGSDFLQPLKSQGVVEVDDYGLVISTKFMSKPGKQFLIRRHAYNAMQQALADAGIDFARPEVRVSVNQDEDRSGKPKDAPPGPHERAPHEHAAEAAGAAAIAKLTKPVPASGTA